MRFLLLSFIVLLLSACGDEPVTLEEKINKVTVQPLSSLLAPSTVYRSARAISLNDSTISSELNANVAAVYTDVGASVEKGDLLIELDCKDERSRLLQSQSQLAANQASAKLSLMDFRRAQKLLKEKNISKQEFDRLQTENLRSQANEKNTKAALQLAESAVNKCAIRSPFKAVVAHRMAAIGQFVSQGTPLIRVVDTSELEVSVALTPRDSETLAASKAIYFLNKGEKYPLELRAVTGVVDSRTRTQETRLRFKQQTPIPGSSGELVWTHPDLFLPAEYLTKRDGIHGLLYIDQQENQTVVKLLEIPDVVEGQPVPIQYNEELMATTPVIVDGRYGLRVGENVEVIEP